MGVFFLSPGPGESRAAMKNLNGKDVAGSRIRVKKAQQKPGSKSRNKYKQQADSPEKN